MRKWLSRFGGVGGQVANVLTFLTTSWGVVLSAAIGIAVFLSKSLTALVHNEGFRAGVETFVVVLWTYIGLYIIFTRRRPVLTKRVVDLRYGLSIENIFILYQADQEHVLQFGVSIRNYSGEPLEYLFRKFDVFIKSRHSGLDAGVSKNIIPFGVCMGFRGKAYKNDEISDLFSGKQSGRMHIEFDYGLLNEGYSRKVIIDYDIELTFLKDNGLGRSESIKRYEEVAISHPI